MKWFRHNSDSYVNLKLQELIEEFGMEGYGFFWICCELVAHQGENYRIKNGKNWKKALTNISNVSTEKIEIILNKLATINLIDKKGLKNNILFIPKMKEYSDDYTNRVRRVSEQGSYKVRQHNNTIHNNTIHTYLQESFNLFWKEYPRKVGKGKCEKIWNKIKPDKTLNEKIIKSLQEHQETEQWQKNEGKFIPHPSTFLNEKRWEDEIKEKKLNPLLYAQRKIN